MFTAKSARAFDPEIAGYIERAGIERRLDRLLDSEFDHRVVVVALAGHASTCASRARSTRRSCAAALGRRRRITSGGQSARRAGADGRAHAAPRTARGAAPAIRFDDVVKPELRAATGASSSAACYRVDWTTFGETAPALRGAGLTERAGYASSCS